ncbi:MAG: aldolase/citrate lyase family protein [Planctomycetota bacterium]|nr:aldolase/citrate lyase family protein [Planctomycetota bacterium]
MYCNTQKFRDKMDSGQPCFGPGITFADPAITESIAPTADFVWIDLEHNPTDLQSMLGHLIAARACGTMAIVRVPSGELGWIKRVLDSGAEGIILPQAQSYEEVASFVSACRYPPLGTRGFGPRRPSNYGRIVGQEYLDSANRELFVVAQIETAGALHDIDRIVRIEGLDSVVVGPHDLSGSLGMLGQVEHPTVVEAIERIVRTARDAGLYVGMGMGASAEFAIKNAKIGVHWLQVGNDFEYMNLFADKLYAELLERTSGMNQ